MSGGILLWSTYFTSVWIWIFALSSFVVRAATALTQGLRVLGDVFDVAEKPLSTMGYVAGGLCACAWWGICLVDWLRGNFGG